MSSTITQSSLTTPAPTTDTATGSNALGETQFMQLLLAQLQNQDPTQPVDNQQMVAQLATFSQLEQQTTTNTNLQTLITGQASQTETSVVNLVGKQVTYSSNTAHLASYGSATTLNATLAAPAASISATLTDSTGKVVRTIKQTGAMSAGQVSLAWDGKDDGGNSLPAGDYTIAFTAADASGNAVSTSTTQTGVCSGISYANGYAQPLIGTTPIKMSDIVSINASSTTSP